MAAIDSSFVARPSDRERPSAALVALSLMQLVIGYEWLVSGLSKIANGDFAHGLGAELRDLAQQASPWYGHFLRSAIVPHALAFGYVIELAELVAGIVLLGVAFTELATGARLRRRTRVVLHRLAVAALAVGVLLVANFELANGGSFGLRLASDSFDEGVDLDTIMVAAQLALIVALAPAMRRRRR